MNNFFFVVLSLSLILFSSCGGDSNNTNNNNTEVEEVINFPTDNVVRIREGSNIDALNPIISATQTARNVQKAIFQELFDLHPITFELRPVLAIGKPKVTSLEEGEYAGGMSIEMEIHPEAVWDNGKPITAEDYLFTVKAIKNPKVNAANLRPYMDFIDDIKIDPNNPKKFTVYSKERYILSESVAATSQIIPEYHYDPQGFMRSFEIAELNNQNNLEKLNNNTKIVDFAETFNTKYNLEPETIVGSGPYKLKEIKTSQHIILERKENWWGDKLDLDYMKAYPQKIIYKIIPDNNGAILALKSNEIDLFARMTSESFNELKEDPEIVKRFSLTTPDQFSYAYIGFNRKSPKLDKLTRQAIGCITDVDRIIDLTYAGLATPVNSPISPLKAHYHKGLPNLKFDLAKAKELLKEAGWADSDGDGILDKEIEGKRVPLTLSFKYPQASATGKTIGLLMKEEAKRVGMEIDIISREWTVFLEETKKRDFDMYFAAWSAAPTPDDLKQIWHTSSNTYDGSNKVGFGTEETDKIIDEIRVTLDEAKRTELYMKIQEKISEDYPYLFLFVPKNCMAISKRFENIETYSIRPGYFPMQFKLKESVAKQATDKEEQKEKEDTH